MTRRLIALGCVASGMLVMTVGTGCEKPKKANPTTNAPAGGGNPTGGTGFGSVDGVRGALKRVVEMNDMRNIHLVIESMSAETGKMPSSTETYAAIQKEARKLAEKIDDGSITLCSPKSREEIWAYETEALQKGGWVCTSSGPEQMDAATLKKRLGK